MQRSTIYKAALPLAALTAAALMAAPATAQGFRPITERADFVQLIQGRELTRFGIRLAVSPGGDIRGRAFGADVTGNWNWSGEYFCRTLNFGSQTLENNCQRVTVSGSTVRFTADRGAGDTADLQLR